MAETQKFICPGRYFGRYCSDEREFEYARILEKSNKKACKELKNYYESSIKLCEEIDKILEELKEQGLIDINI